MSNNNSVLIVKENKWNHPCPSIKVCPVNALSQNS